MLNQKNVVLENQSNPQDKRFKKEYNFINPLENLEKYTLDEHGSGLLFADTFKDKLRFVYDVRRWYCFNGKVWKGDTAEIEIEKCASELLWYLKSLIPNKDDNNESEGNNTGESTDDEIYDKLKTFISDLSKYRKRKTMILEARKIYSICMQDFDSNPYLLNCQNGTFNLKSFELQPHKPEDLLTKISNASYEPRANAGEWGKFVREIMCDDFDLMKYLQKSFGYALTGDTSYECFFVIYGPKTRNGKGTCMESVLNVLGDYSNSISPASISKKSVSSNNPTPEFARVAGVRLVNISEPDKGLKLNVALIKRLTGGDPIIARNLFENPFEYRPQFKMFINTNHLFEINDDTIFSSNRIKMIPFDRHFTEKERNQNLKYILTEPKNASAILNWLIEGYKLLQKEGKEGLEMPKRAKAALEEYRKESDTVALFMEDEDILEIGDNKKHEKTVILYKRYVLWCYEKGIEDKSQKEFVATLKSKGLVTRSGKEGNIVKGYKIKPETE